MQKNDDFEDKPNLGDVIIIAAIALIISWILVLLMENIR